MAKETRTPQPTRNTKAGKERKTPCPPKSRGKGKAPKTTLKRKRPLQRSLRKKAAAKMTTPSFKTKKGKEPTLFGHYHRLNQELQQKELKQIRKDEEMPSTSRDDEMPSTSRDDEIPSTSRDDLGSH
ncbi:spermatid nuclear transition protein 4-like [Cynocephalus volans]|uniref:spermatid nuclear transition protein 4-like n=1 Tax=Cynocephalus volans TaxID=110931 RepID=UPI002FC7EC2D